MRSNDAIQLDRATIARRASRLAKTKAESTESIYKLKPKQIEALTVLKDYFPVDLQSIVLKGLRNSLQKKTFEKLVRLINKETKESGSPNASTISQFEKLITDLQSTALEDRQIDETINVLFYADRRS
jgi:Ni,Fe-hydrogenase I large subunit